MLKGGCYSHATDTFSLGVILWEIVTLEQPWKFTCAPSLPQRGVVAAMALHDTRVSEEVRGVIGCTRGPGRRGQGRMLGGRGEGSGAGDHRAGRVRAALEWPRVTGTSEVKGRSWDGRKRQ